MRPRAGEIEGGVVLLAGGTDVLVKAREGRPYADKTVVDVYGIPELCKISETQTELIIGAGVTIRRSRTRRWCAGTPAFFRTPAGRWVAPDPKPRDHRRQHCKRVSGGRFACGARGAGSRGGDQPPRGDPARAARRDHRKAVSNDADRRELITRIFVKKVPHGCKYDFYKLGRRNALSISRMTIERC